MVTPKTEADVIDDIFRRIRSAEEQTQRRLDDELARKIELDVRRDWGGNKVHIAGPVRLQQAERASRVHRAYLEGKRLAEIARQEGVSTRWVIKIVKR